MNKQTKKGITVFANYAYGELPKRTPWTILRATLWLGWWNVRMWFADRGLFVRKIYINEKNEVFDDKKMTKRTIKLCLH